MTKRLTPTEKAKNRLHRLVVAAMLEQSDDLAVHQRHQDRIQRAWEALDDELRQEVTAELDDVD